MNGNSVESSLDFEAARSRLRQRWELASVLNFFKVFEPVTETNLKISAEEVETALIIPNRTLAQLHIALLKGIPPVSKNLNNPDAWVVALCKKLTMWWPWVAEGEFPLAAAKGTEMETYKELDSTIRLVILKALCEIRADQHDVVSYINDGVKKKNELSLFRKNNLGEDGKGTSYWCDGNEIIGFRLYKEFTSFRKNGTPSSICCRWETLATNLEEFQKVVDEYASSSSKLEVSVGVAVETEVIPFLTKLYKKKQRALQKKRSEEKIIDTFCRSGVTRSCRSRGPISYTFDEYDKAINEAIRETKKMKPKDERMMQKKAVALVKEDSEQDDKSSDGKSAESESESESSKRETEVVSEDSSREESGEEASESESENENESDSKENTSGSVEIENESVVDKTSESKKVNGCIEDGNFGTKKRSRQRPNRNTALESAVVPDSDDEVSSECSDS